MLSILLLGMALLSQGTLSSLFSTLTLSGFFCREKVTTLEQLQGSKCGIYVEARPDHKYKTRLWSYHNQALIERTLSAQLLSERIT